MEFHTEFTNGDPLLVTSAMSNYSVFSCIWASQS